MAAKEEVAFPTKSTSMESFSNQSYAEWAAAYQAYYANGASTPFPCFYPPVGSGPQSQPYHWGGQPLMGPYGNPPFPPCPYPYGYVHPTMANGAMPYNPYALPSPSTELVMAAPMAETDAKSSFTCGSKQTNGSLNAMVQNDETIKATSGSECGMGDFSSDRSEEEGTPNEFQTTSRAFNTFAKGKCATGTFTNLNTAMEYWSQSTPIGLQGMRGSSDLSATSLPCHPMGQSKDQIGSDIWSKDDDKETKRQKRKQSNRESARRSRLRKQAECGELSTRVDSLMAENSSLRTELDRLSAECKKLVAENEAIMRVMQAHKGGEANEISNRPQVMQSENSFAEEDTSPGSKRTIFHMPNELQATTLHDLGACVLSLMGQTDSITAG